MALEWPLLTGGKYAEVVICAGLTVLRNKLINSVIFKFYSLNVCGLYLQLVSNYLHFSIICHHPNDNKSNLC
jgi:hypothetical protein